jgi:hypothetical protein
LLGIVEQFKDHIFGLFLDLLVLVEFLNVLHSLFHLEWFIDLYDDVDHLVFQPNQGHLEVEHRYHQADLRGVMGSAQFRCQVEFKIP